MRILEKGIGYTYVFICPGCGSRLEAERDELRTRLGDTEAKFYCPVCERERWIDWSQIDKQRKTVTATEES